MLILWIPLGVAIIYLLIRAVYLRIWDRGLSVELAFGQHAVSEGQQATLRATVTNAKLLPLPVLMLRYKMNRGLRMGENANATVTDKLNVVEYFSVLGNERVVREQPEPDDAAVDLRSGEFSCITAGYRADCLPETSRDSGNVGYLRKNNRRYRLPPPSL